MRFFCVAIATWALAAGATHAQPLEEVVDFEELEPKCVASRAMGQWGSGPIRIHGTSHRFGTTTNAAVVVDTAHPDVGDSDLATRSFHNALIVSRIRPARPVGVDAPWVAGSVPIIDDEDIPGAVLAFDFTEVGTVTFYGLTLLDHDDHPATLRIYRQTPDGGPLAELGRGTRLDLTWGRKSWFTRTTRLARLHLPDEDSAFYRLQVGTDPEAGRPRALDVRSLRAYGKESRSLVGRQPILADGIPDVTRVEVVLGGSSAVDRLIFRRQARGAVDGADEDLFAKIERRIANALRDDLRRLHEDFTGARDRLLADPTPTLRSDLEGLIARLDRELLGTRRDDGTRAGGLLQCPELPCGCPELRALRAWVGDRIAKIRTDLEAADPEALPTVTAGRAGLRIAALDAARYAVARPDAGSVDLAQQARSEGCETGTFWEQFFCEGEVIFRGVSDTVASLLGPEVRLGETAVVAGSVVSCSAWRLTPKSPDFDHVETGILPGQPRKVPRGLYCVHCRTDGGLRPVSTLDLVSDGKAAPATLGDESERCSVGG